MEPHIALLFDEEDGKIFLDRYGSRANIIAYTISQSTAISLQKIGISAVVLDQFLPLPEIKKMYQLAARIAEMFEPRIFASVRIFFLELLRSVAITKRFMEKNKPNGIYISDLINESIFKKYHSQQFNLLNQVFIAYCKQHHLPIIILRQRHRELVVTQSIFIVLSTIKSIITPVRNDAPKQAKKNTMLIAASNYHLTNLRSFISLAHRKWNVVILGKINPKEKTLFSSRQIGTIDTTKLTFSIWDFFSMVKFQLFALLGFYRIYDHGLQIKLLNILAIDCWKIVSEQCQYWTFVLAPEGELFRKFFKRMLQKYCPQVLITSNSIDNFNRTLHLEAKRLKIHDCVILHYPLLAKTDAIEEQSGIESILFASSTLHVTTKSRVVVTGLPVYDKYHHKNISTRKNLPLTSIRILLLLSEVPLYFQNQIDGILKELFDELKGFEHSLTITIRGHPHSSLVPMHVTAHPRVIFQNNIPLDDEIKRHNLVITQPTSAAINAIIFRKPLIYLNTHGTKNYCPFATSGAAIGVYRIEDLKSAILSLIKNPRQLDAAQKEFLKTFCNNIDGKASINILRYIDRYMYTHESL